MDKNKMDKKIKESLEIRTIQPSENSWEELSERLYGQEKKSSRKFWWVGIAASFLVGVLLTALVFQRKNENLETMPLVSKEKEQKTEASHKEQPTKKVLSTTQKKQTLTVSETSNTTEKNQTDNPQKATKQIVSFEEMSPKKIEQKNNKIVEVKPDSIGQKPDGLVEETSAKILDHINQRDDSTQVTDAEINRLIREATMDIKGQDIFDENDNHVNAQALLKNVENDLKRSFRERVFEAVQEGLHQVRTAVVNRSF